MKVKVSFEIEGDATLDEKMHQAAEILHEVAVRILHQRHSIYQTLGRVEATYLPIWEPEKKAKGNIIFRLTDEITEVERDEDDYVAG